MFDELYKCTKRFFYVETLNFLTLGRLCCGEEHLGNGWSGGFGNLELSSFFLSVAIETIGLFKVFKE